MNVRRYRAPSNGRFRLDDTDPDDHGSIASKAAAERLLEAGIVKLRALQEVLYGPRMTGTQSPRRWTRQARTARSRM